jgi:cell division protein FtsB
MKAKPTNMDRKKPVKIVSWIIIGIVFIFMLILGRNSFIKVVLAQREAVTLQKKVELLKTENEKLRQENQNIKTNPDTVEKIAREKLGYQKSDEKVFRFLKQEEENTESAKDKK